MTSNPSLRRFGKDAQRPSGRYFLLEDFVGSTLDTTSNWYTAVVGTGSAIALTSAIGGQVLISLGTGKGSSAELSWRQGSQFRAVAQPWYTPARIQRIVWRAKVVPATTGSWYYLGVGDVDVDAFRWTLDPPTYGDSNWRIERAFSGVVQGTPVASGIANDTANFHKYELRFTPTQNALAYYDGTYVGDTGTLTVITYASLYPWANAAQNTRNASGSIYVDYCLIEVERS